MPKIISNKKYLEIMNENEKLRKQSELLNRGYRSISECIDYQRVLVAIFKTQNLREIEISDNWLYGPEDEIEVLHTSNNTTKIRVRRINNAKN